MLPLLRGGKFARSYVFEPANRPRLYVLESDKERSCSCFGRSSRGHSVKGLGRQLLLGVEEVGSHRPDLSTLDRISAVKYH